LYLEGQNNRQFSRILAKLKQQAQNQESEHQSQHEFLRDFASQLIAVIEEGKRAALNQAIISSLWFKTLRYREDSVAKAYDHTIGWLFDRDKTPFCQWLESGEGIFWISGLAGSGKSTLMKFASRNENTTTLLSNWARGRSLHVGHFYFWNSGFPMQKSQQGLLQSLLVQIFSIHPDLVSSLCPDHKPSEPWGIEELQGMFKMLQDESLPNLAFCFFIDGLDEYGGEESEILDVLQSLSKVSHIKICASSRPWTAFEKAFTDLHRKLLVQDHTRDDMKLYVQGMLKMNIDFQKLAAEDSRCQSLVSEIANRANGVWLWVYLVVKDLTRDIGGNESYDFLRKRLDAVPNGLEKYFEKIMIRIDDIHKEESSQIFLLILESVRPPPLLALEILRMERKDPNFALGESFPPLTPEDVNRICDSWTPKLWSRCGDLLNVRTDDKADYLFRRRVEFLHRTVGDWLREHHHGALRKGASRNFDATTSLCRISFAFARLAIEMILSDCFPNWFIYEWARMLIRSLICDFGIYVLHLQDKEMDDVIFPYIAALDSILSRRLTVTVAPRDVWDIWRLFHNTIADPYPSFLGVVIDLGLSRYAQDILLKDPHMLKKSGRPLLSYSVWPSGPRNGINIDFKSEISYQAHLDLVKFLLCHGADPNEIVPNSSHSVLYEFAVQHKVRGYDRHPQAEQQYIFKVAELLVQHGGSLNRQFYGNKRSARDHFEKIFRANQIDQLKAIGNAKEPQEKWWSSPLLWK
jgi:hypothetical protein